MLHRMLVAASIAVLVMTLSFAHRAAPPPPRAGAIVHEVDATQLLKRLDTLDGRLRTAQDSIDRVLVALSNADDTERDVARMRLDVLYRLEEGLTHDIVRTRGQLAMVSLR